jgi:hypothetical protein
LIGVFSVRSRRDNRFDASVNQVAANIIAVVALVAEEHAGIGLMQPHERVIAFDLVRRAAGDIEGQRVAFGVRAEVNLGREAAARAPERLPPRTPRDFIQHALEHLDRDFDLTHATRVFTCT